MHTHRTFETHAHVGWESRYFSEGRDSLDGKSLWNSSLELGYDHFSGGFWYGRSSNHQYDEWQYTFAITQKLGGYEIHAGYTHLIFPKGDESDDEWSVGVSFEELPIGFSSSLDAYYSMDTTGTFFEWVSTREFEPRDDLDVLISGSLGWNEGYIPEGHNGLNFICFRCGIEKQIGESLSITGHGSQNLSVNRNLSLVGDAQLKDFFHFGLGMEYNF